MVAAMTTRPNAAARKCALITGITGQDGRYLAEFLLSQEYDVFGLIRGQNNPRATLLRHELPDLKIISGDLLDVSSLINAVVAAAPDEIYNLGAVSFVPYSWENPRLTTDVTGGGVLNVLEAARFYQDQSGKAVRFFQASSAEMFGKVRETPQRESTQLWPRSPYAVAKVYGHHLTINYRESYGMHASCGILFNHESPRRGPEFVTRKISQAAARISLGLQDSVALGNLNSQRDWGFAGDYVEAMYLMTQRDEPDDYVIATGETHSIADLLDVAFAAVGIDDWTPYVKIDRALMRPAEVEILVGDATKASEVLGWKPKLAFHELIEMMVRHDVEIQSSDAAATGAGC
jgi:GDPmannose 4,6-dehydratase